ncbi:O-antigen ligase family protein, partial [Aquabacterium sp.]|uniref:O-antigen ligase family protein n=1 Tax=Aquabacterium sp. TaxID=1872578 RepID=UPI003D6DA579
MAILWFLAGFLPFVSWGRVAPIASFWPQWGAATIFLIIGTAQFLKNRNRLEFAGRSSFDGAVILLFLSISAQSLTGHVYSKTSAFIAVGALALGWIFTKVSTLAVVRDPTRSLDVWCMGVSAALLFQAFVVGLGVFGKEFVHGFLFDAPPQLRALGAFGQSNHLGVFSVLALACLHHLFAKRRITPWMLWGGVAISALVCALSYSRAALLVWGALAVIAAIPLWKSRRRGDDEKKVWHAHVYVCVFFLTVQMLNFMVPLMPLISGMQDGPSLLTDSRAMSSNARLEQIRDSFQLIEKYPYFGVGYEGFAGARLCDLSGSLMEPQTTVPHNLLLQFFVELGLIGALIDLWVIFAVFKVVRLALLDSENFSSDRLLAVQWIVGLFVYSMFEFPLLYSYFLLPFLMMAGLAGYPIVSVGVGRPLKIALTSALVFGFIGLFLIACDYP